MSSLLEMGDWILEATPADGSPITNPKVREQIARQHRELSDTEYFEARDHMCGLGWLGRKPGSGGMIYRTRPVVPDVSPPTNDWNEERNLYAPISYYLHLSFTRHLDIETGVDVKAFDVSPNWQSASGRWTVPDIVLIARQSYEFFSGYDLEVITFEIKTQKGLLDALGRPLYQAYAQSAFAHRGYLIWHCADKALLDLHTPRLKVDCKTTGIGLIVCSDPLNHSTYEIVEVAAKRAVATASVDQFLSDILSEEQTAEVTNWLKA